MADYCSDCDKEIQLDRDTYNCDICNLMICENCFYESHTNHNKIN